MTPATLEVERIGVPPSLADAQAEPFAAIARLSNAMCRHDTGHAHFDTTPGEMLPSWHDTADRRHTGFAVRRDGEVLGVAVLQIPTEADARNVEFDIIVDPRRWGEGVEDELVRQVECEAAALGRTALQTYTLHRADAVARVIAPESGWGGVPADDRQTRLMRAAGYRLEQVERNSVLDLPGSREAIERMLQTAREAAGADYRVLTWTLPTPSEHLDGFAFAISRMSTDVPMAGMLQAEEVWDAHRVRRRDRRLIDSGLTVSVACAQHVATGRIVAYTELTIGDDPTGATHQWGTLVVREHRGRRLGMLVKCANLLRWSEIAPRSPLVSTFNAEENRHMLDVNEAMGFVPAALAGAWQKTAAPIS
ncbi:GNAT family N-acetyltransferase [Microbacterium fluvii]|uniref:GNAT family N-acetyltransferase n=1 Tax=Microbacterium fluvii TaxID=415215 RepID=A0ABW2HCA7_9MICO|nr:GNAT family N-acetyltransferase [Microbacterium fluvii]MCU4672112.1 GNAT family N-acetyltransferase [Microbacterium fluvii]